MNVKRLFEALQVWHEAAKNPGILSRDGWKLALQFRAHVASYFNSMADAIDLAHLSEGEYSMIEPHLRSVMARAQPLFLNAYKHHAQLAINAANRAPVYLGDQLYTEADFDLPSPIDQAKRDALLAKLDKVGMTAKQAIDYITEHGAELIAGIDDYTLKVMRSLIAQGIEDQLGVQGTVKLIREEFQEMSSYRAKSIATTEINDAMSEAALGKIRAVGLDGKRWIRSPGACPICTANTAQGIIPVNQAFQSGHQRPPAHPGKCRCAVAGARLAKAA